MGTTDGTTVELSGTPQRAWFDIGSARFRCGSAGKFQKAVDHLREIQAEPRSEQERHLKRAAAFLELHKHKGIPV
jgi:hypothetical protein